MKKSVVEIARELARAHQTEDPETTDVFFHEDVADEVRLVEVSGSLGDVGPGEVLPFRFQPQPPDVPYASVIVLLSPSEWQAVKDGKLALPLGWDQAKLKKVI